MREREDRESKEGEETVLGGRYEGLTRDGKKRSRQTLLARVRAVRERETRERGERERGTDLVGEGEGGDRVALAAVLVGFAAEDLLDQRLLAHVLRCCRRHRHCGCWSRWGCWGRGRSCVGVGEGEGDGLHFAAQARLRLCSESQHTSTAMVVRAPFHGEHEGIL